MADGGCDSSTGERSEADERVRDGIECEASASSVMRNSGIGPRGTVSAGNGTAAEIAYQGHHSGAITRWTRVSDQRGTGQCQGPLHAPRVES
jgi:hypothetical protein